MEELSENLEEGCHSGPSPLPLPPLGGGCPKGGGGAAHPTTIWSNFPQSQPISYLSVGTIDQGRW